MIEVYWAHAHCSLCCVLNGVTQMHHCIMHVFHLQKELLTSFNDGEMKVFFELWTENVPAHIRDSDPTIQKLEFYLHIHFVIYPLKNSVGKQVHTKYVFVMMAKLDISLNCMLRNLMSQPYGWLLQSTDTGDSFHEC